MSDTNKNTDSKGSFRWEEVLLRAVIPGVLIAIAGFVGEWVISSSSTKAENARLVTNLQIQREQAESDLRKDIFGQAVAALIGSEDTTVGIEDYSKRLLKLELLALNFGDSIFLSPLFAEFEKDLRRHMASNPGDGLSILKLMDRLRSLAKRVSASQLSFLAQRGASVPIHVSLAGNGEQFCNGKTEYKWPDDYYPGIKPCAETAGQIHEGQELPMCSEVQDGEHIPLEILNQLLVDTASLSLDKKDAETRYVTAVFSEPKPERASIRVSLTVCPFDGKPECDLNDPDTIERTFTLDYFNFPTIDNTRLPNNDRFAVVLDDFSFGDVTDEEDDTELCASTLDVYVVLFPYEYASLRDRPTMRESLQMLERAQDSYSEDHKK